MRQKISYIVLAVLAIALLFSLERCNAIRNNADLNTAALTDTVKYYHNKLGTQTASIKTLQLEKNQFKNVLLKKDKELAALAAEFSKVHTVTKFKTITRYDTIAVVYKDTVPCLFKRSGRVNDRWYGFGYRVNQNGFTLDSLTVANTATVVTGTKRKWFLGKEIITTDITNSNPHIKVTGITSAEIVIPEPWYKKWYVWLAAGVAGGFLLAK